MALDGQRRLSNIAIPAPFTGTGQSFSGDVVIAGNRVTALQDAPVDDPAILIPAPVEAHCHLDKCHTIDRMPGVGGDLRHAIAAQWDDKQGWTADDIRKRAGRGLRELKAAGCTLVRSHVDWEDSAKPPLAWSVLNELSADTDMDLTLSPLTSVHHWLDPDIADGIVKAAVPCSAALGLFLHDQADRATAIRAIFVAADRNGLGLDFHVDEGLQPGLDGLETVADVAIETGFQGPILCGHAVSLMNATGDDLKRITDKLLAANIAIVALPTTNLYLQGRAQGTPDRRGLTRLLELDAAGVPIVLGSDNVGDAFCPVGRFDPMEMLHLAVLAAHLDPPLERWLPTITTNAMRALGRDPLIVPGAPLEQLRLSRAPGVSGLISGAAPLTPITQGLLA